jgi:hypothetical protein
MHEPELTIDEVEVQTQALAAGRDQPGPALAGGDIEAVARFDGGQHANQPFGDLIALGDGLGQGFLARGAAQVNVRAARLFGRGPGVPLDGLGMLGDKAAKILDSPTLARYECLHGIRPAQGQVALEENPVEAGNRAGDVGLMVVDKAFHGVLLSMGA